jgi:hypothetical protein
MAARRSRLFPFAIRFAFAALPLALVAPAFGQAQQEDDQPPQVENARTRWIGVVTANGVQVRSAPSGSAYPTMRLGDGTQVIIAGLKGDWLKIEPPEGSYSLVPKSKVNRRGVNGTVGRTNDATVVKAGSQLMRVKMGAQARLEPNTDVTILGEEDEYYKIKPPEGAYLFVNKKDVRPVRKVGEEVVANGQGQPRPGTANAGNNAQGQPMAREPREGDTTSAQPTQQGETANAGNGTQEIPTTVTPTERVNRTTQPQGEGEVAANPTTQPSDSAALAKFEDLERQFEAANGKPALEQPLDELQTGYAALLADDNGAALPSSARRIAQIRVAAIKARVAARDQYREFEKAREQAAERQKSLVAERQEIQERIEKTGVQTYTAVGTLRVSSLQQGNTTLYRLTDPGTGRTVAYVRSNDAAKYGPLLNQFVGIRGTVATDAKLAARVITPTEAQPVDPSKVNDKVIAQIVPPSLIGSTANTTNEKAISE